MSGWKGGGLLLILAIPLGFYAAWHVKGVVRADMVVSDPPPDRGGTKEQLAAVRDKAAKGAADARKVTTVAFQYREPTAAETPGDAVAKEVVAAAGTRALNLTSLDLFLSGVELDKIPATPAMKGLFVGWKKEMDEVQSDAKGVEDWLNRAAVVTAPTEGNRAMGELEELLRKYLSHSNFSSPPDAARWRVLGRLKVIKELSAMGDAQYPAAMKVDLPLRPGNDALKTALQTFAAVKAQNELLKADIKRAEAVKANVATAHSTEINVQKANVTKCETRKKLLDLFAQDDLFTNPTGAGAWLREVATLYRGQMPEEDRREVRKKVQQFCDAYIPPVVRLDDTVLFQGGAARRTDITVEYEPAAGARVVTEVLSASHKGLNEFNLAEKYPGKSTEVRHKTIPGGAKDLAPTGVSKAALLYNEVREAVAPGASGPKWTANTVEDLKKKCEPQKDLVEKVKLPKSAGAAADAELKIWTRLNSLLEGLQACGDLIDG